jgi:putative ABC transport system substrate-binding protein
MHQIVAYIALSIVLLIATFPADAQVAKRAFRIGYLGNFRPSVESTHQDPFFLGLREQGWIEGQNIMIERRYWGNIMGQLPGLVDELVRLKVDLIAASTGMAALLAKKATTTIPIVVIGAADAVALGLVDSLARPGGNVTGMTSNSPDVIPKQLKLLKEILPKVSRVAVLTCPRERSKQWIEVQPAAQVLKMYPQFLDIRGPEDSAPAFQEAIRQHADALLVLNCPLIPSSETTELTTKSRLPAIYGHRRFMEAGGLMMYGASGLSRQAAVYVDKILRGVRPADLPVQQPVKFELVINLKTAKQVGVTIPSEMLMWADEVIR